jgi:hypothetical protein
VEERREAATKDRRRTEGKVAGNEEAASRSVCVGVVEPRIILDRGDARAVARKNRERESGYDDEERQRVGTHELWTANVS